MVDDRRRDQRYDRQGLSRRRLLVGGASTLAALNWQRPCLAQSEPERAPVPAASGTGQPTRVMPVGFVSHGAPRLAIDPVRGAELAAWGKRLPQARGILVMTPHVRARQPALGPSGPGFAMYNFPRRFQRGFPDLDYPTPPSEALAQRVEGLFRGRYHFDRLQRKGFDHTTWAPLLHLFPAADVPVLEVALPFWQDAQLFAFGQELAPLREEGIFFLGSGGATHNLAALDQGTATPGWARDFTAWIKHSLEARDTDSLVEWRRRAPAQALAHPDDGGHFRVLLVASGVASGKAGLQGARVASDGFEFASLSKLCVELS